MDFSTSAHVVYTFNLKNVYGLWLRIHINIYITFSLGQAVALRLCTTAIKSAGDHIVVM